MKLLPGKATRQQAKQVIRRLRKLRSKAAQMRPPWMKPARLKPRPKLHRLHPAQTRWRLNRQAKRRTRPRRSSPLVKNQKPDIDSSASAALKRTSALAARFNEVT